MKISHNIPVLLILLVFGLGPKGYAQEGSYVEVRDFEVWSAAELKYKWNKKWAFGLEEQLRFKNNASEVDQYFTQLSLKYIGFDHLEFGGALRFIRDNDNVGAVQGYENHLRFHVDLGYKYKLSKFSIKHRLRYQNRNELGISEEDGDYAKQNFRFKTSLKYNIKDWKFDPEIAGEIFYHKEFGEVSAFNKYRLTLGTDYKIKKFGEIGAFYRMEHELNVSFPKTTHIIGLSYVYTLKNKKK